MQTITLDLLILMRRDCDEVVLLEGISNSSFSPKMESAVLNLDKFAWTAASNCIGPLQCCLPNLHSVHLGSLLYSVSVYWVGLSMNFLYFSSCYSQHLVISSQTVLPSAMAVEAPELALREYFVCFAVWSAMANAIAVFAP